MAWHSPYTVVRISGGWYGIGALISLIRSRVAHNFYWLKITALVARRRFIVLSCTAYVLCTITTRSHAQLRTPTASVYYLCEATSSSKHPVFNLLPGESSSSGMHQIYKPSISKCDELSHIIHNTHVLFRSMGLASSLRQLLVFNVNKQLLFSTCRRSLHGFTAVALPRWVFEHTSF